MKLWKVTLRQQNSPSYSCWTRYTGEATSLEIAARKAMRVARREEACPPGLYVSSVEEISEKDF